MRMLAEGRASAIYDLGDGRVLRRFKGGGDPAFEARVMEHARAHGFPVPAVHEVRDDALVLERVEGRRQPTQEFKGLSDFRALHPAESPTRKRGGLSAVGMPAPAIRPSTSRWSG